MKYNDNQETREQIDELLRQNAVIQSNLGTEHEKNSPERKEARSQWRELLKQIRALDSEFAKVIEPQNT